MNTNKQAGQNEDLVWYASYGSNLQEERFLCYIMGGKAIGSNKSNPGCKDKTPPRDTEEIYIESEMYFAKSSSVWDGGGMAFIKTDFNKGVQTFGRIYLITKEQFVDIVKKEINFTGELTIDFDRAINENSYVFKDRSLYGNIIYLGNQYNYPIFTFTNERNIAITAKPSISYLKTITKGIIEVFPNISAQEIADYLFVKDGVYQHYSKNEIIALVSEQK